MPRWKKFIEPVTDFARGIYFAPSSHQYQLLKAARDRTRRHEITGSEVDLDAAIAALKLSLENSPRDPETKATLYFNLAAHFTAKYSRFQAKEALGEAIRAYRASIKLTRQHEPIFAERLRTLAYWLIVRFEANPTGGDDVEAIEILKQGLAVPQLATSTRARLLDHLFALKMIQTGPDAVKAMHTGNPTEPGRPQTTILPPNTRVGNSLRESLAHRQKQKDYLDLMIEVKESLVLPESAQLVGGPSNQARFSQDLGCLYGGRWSITREVSDIQCGIEHLRNSLLHASEDDKANCWYDLGLLLSLRGFVLKADHDLDEAARCFQESTRLQFPTDSPDEHLGETFASRMKSNFRSNLQSYDPHDGTRTQQELDRISIEFHSRFSATAGVDEPDRTIRPNTQSDDHSAQSSLQLLERMSDDSAEPHTPIPATLTQSAELRDDTTMISKLEAFHERWGWKQVQLLVAFRFSPTYERLLASIRDEYDGLVSLQCEFSSRNPRLTWQRDFESWLDTNDIEREMTFTELPENIKHEIGLVPFSMLLFLHDDHLRGEPCKDRLSPYKAVMENWERARELYQETAAFRNNLSRHQEHSFGILKDWWESAYTDTLDMNDFRQQLASFLEHPPSFNLQVSWAEVQWRSRSVYHSSCLELFFREFHTYSWEPFARRSCLAALGAARNHAYRVALKQRYAWSAFQSSAKGKDPEATLAQRVYPQYFHESRFMGDNPLLEEELFRPFKGQLWGTLLSDTKQWDDHNPAYLWDTENRRTTPFRQISTPVDYTCISHTWGRWQKEGTMARIEGVPWAVPENTLYDVHDLPGILEKCLLPNERYIWIDLFCIPQDDSDPGQKQIEIHKQTWIFGRSQRCIAWLHDVDKWTGVRNALTYLAATYVRDSSTDDGRGVGLPITQDQLQSAHDRAGNHLELMQTDKWAPSTWFSSLWTLQEAVLCPDLQLCSKNMEILVDDHDCPIGLRTLFVITSALQASNLAIPVSSNLPTPGPSLNMAPPISVLQFRDLCNLTRFDQLLLGLYPTAVLIQSSVRQCRTSRASAIMSALAITDWDSDTIESADDPPLVLNSFPLAFVQAAARKIGAVFFYHYSTGPRRSSRPYSTRAIMYHEQEAGSLLPFSEPQELQTRIKLAAVEDDILKPMDHESIGSWRILLDGGVEISSAAIMASSDSTYRNDTSVEAALVVHPHRGLKSSRLRDELTSFESSLNEGVVRLAGDEHDCFAVVLFEDLGRQHGVILRGPRVEGRPARELVKIGLFQTFSRAQTPESVAVSWKVL